MNEFELISKIKSWVGEPPEEMLGIGDDAAVLSMGPDKTVVTTDCLIEGVHFDLELCTPKDVGYKAMAVNLSDLAAMGATPKFALISLVLTENRMMVL